MFEPFEDEEEEGALYEGGHWEWNSQSNELVFVSDLSIPAEEYASPPPTAFCNIEFKDSLDIMDQQRFRKRFQRKAEGEEDIIFLQDIKDVVLYTAPPTVVTPMIVNILHYPATERFIRALILYCQYYLQVSDEMGKRILELETKIRTPKSDEVEFILEDNLQDLRVLVAKEYVTMILGGAEFKKYHHMGPDKKQRSLSKVDIQIFESIVRIIIQIVWIALGRRSYNQIELEINRIFKSQHYNVVEHRLKSNFEAKMMPHERFVMFGHCLTHGQKLNTRSPLLNELLCNRSIDFRLIGLATIKFPRLSHRLHFFETALSSSERLFKDIGMTMGILGLQRSRYDIMLREITEATSTSSSSASMRARSVSRASRASMKKSTITIQKPYDDIVLPCKNYAEEWIPEEFPPQCIQGRYCNPLQRLKWLARAARLAGKQFSVMRQFRSLRPFHSMHTTKLQKIIERQ